VDDEQSAWPTSRTEPDCPVKNITYGNYQLRSCRRGWNIHWFMPHNFSVHRVWAKFVPKLSDWSPPKSKWGISFEKCHYQWWNVGLWLRHWNKTIPALKESCFALPHKSITGVLASESNALSFFNQGIVHYEFAPVRQTMNQDVYLAVLRCLWVALWRKQPEMWTAELAPPSQYTTPIHLPLPSRFFSVP
jgi:hypothetical protein